MVFAATRGLNSIERGDLDLSNALKNVPKLTKSSENGAEHCQAGRVMPPPWAPSTITQTGSQRHPIRLYDHSKPSLSLWGHRFDRQGADYPKPRIWGKSQVSATLILSDRSSVVESSLGTAKFGSSVVELGWVDIQGSPRPQGSGAPRKPQAAPSTLGHKSGNPRIQVSEIDQGRSIQASGHRNSDSPWSI